MTRADILARAALAGAATGGRTFTGLAALTLATPRTARTQPDVTLARPAVAVACCVAAAAELAADKLPQAPSRLGPPGLGGRLVVAGVCGVVLARRVVPPPMHVVPAEGEPASEPVQGAGRTVAAAAVAVAASGLAAVLGVRWRAWAGRGRRGPLLAALAEDAVVVALGTAAARSA